MKEDTQICQETSLDMNRAIIVGAGLACLVGCATVEPEVARSAPVSVPAANVEVISIPTAPKLKRRVAVARFSNSTRYGKGLLYDGENDPLADQAKDMLVKRLVDSGHFLVFERDNLDAMAFEQGLKGERGATDLVGVDAVIIGSVTEFGRKTEGESGFLSSTKKQTATASVEARLVDPRTSLAFFSASGQGEASVEAGEVAGFGSRAGYDASLNDAAISAAISDMTNEVIGNLSDRTWSTDILRVDGSTVYISGGAKQGLVQGDTFNVETLGELVTSGQSGLPIRLPGKTIAKIEITSFFGDTEYTEGSVAQIVEGSLGTQSASNLVVKEVN